MIDEYRSLLRRAAGSPRGHAAPGAGRRGRGRARAAPPHVPPNPHPRDSRGRRRPRPRGRLHGVRLRDAGAPEAREGGDASGDRGGRRHRSARRAGVLERRHRHRRGRRGRPIQLRRRADRREGRRHGVRGYPGERGRHAGAHVREPGNRHDRRGAVARHHLVLLRRRPRRQRHPVREGEHHRHARRRQLPRQARAREAAPTSWRSTRTARREPSWKALGG